MNFRTSLKELKLDLTDLLLIPYGGIEGDFPAFDIQPKDFLRYAKSDFYENNDKGFIYAITNAKRAIDCQIDEVLFVPKPWFVSPRTTRRN